MDRQRQPEVKLHVPISAEVRERNGKLISDYLEQYAFHLDWAKKWASSDGKIKNSLTKRKRIAVFSVGENEMQIMYYLLDNLDSKIHFKKVDTKWTVEPEYLMLKEESEAGTKKIVEHPQPFTMLMDTLVATVNKMAGDLQQSRSKEIE